MPPHRESIVRATLANVYARTRATALCSNSRPEFSTSVRATIHSAGSFSMHQRRSAYLPIGVTQPSGDQARPLRHNPSSVDGSR